MKQPEKNQSENENRKVQLGTKSHDNPVREDKPHSIHNEDADAANYPHKNKADKQFDTQSEFIDRNSNSKDKS